MTRAPNAIARNRAIITLMLQPIAFLSVRILAIMVTFGVCGFIVIFQSLT